jgi:predicted metal-binding protein
MAKQYFEDTQTAEVVLRSYNLPLKGQLLLACGKCQRKLQQGENHKLSSLKKLLKRQAKQDPVSLRLHVLKVPCLKLCPKNGVTVCTPAQVARHACSIVRSVDDVTALYEQCKTEQGLTQLSHPEQSQAGLLA